MKKRMIIIMLALCIVAGMLPGAVSAADSSETGQDLKKVLFEKLGNVNIADYCEADFDFDGVTEAFALVGEMTDDDYGSWYGNFYFITQAGIEIIIENDYFLIYESQSQTHMLEFPDARFYKIEKWSGAGGQSLVFGVSNGQWYETEISERGYIEQTEPNTMQITHVAWDSITDKTGAAAGGRTFRTYYLYWDNGFHEYGGIKISVSEFLKYDGGSQIYQQIVNDGRTITDIIYRANNIININSIKAIGDGEVSNLNATAKFEDSKIILQERGDFDGGIYATAFFPNIATYPSTFPEHMDTKRERQSLSDGVKYIPYSSRTEDADFTGTALYELDGTLPSGLSLDPGTSVISGVPVATGTWEFQVRRVQVDTVQEIPLSLTIQDNTDTVVQQQRNDYPILEPVGTPDPQNPNHFYKNDYTDETMVIDAPYSEFHRVMIDGQQLVREQDYTSEEGSTRITIRSQTFQKFGEGTHTIAAEFKPSNASGSTIKSVAQNYTLNISQPSSGNPSNNSTQIPAQQTSVPFTDISPADWFYEDVVWAYQKGLMQGSGGNRFDPRGTVSQATIVTVLARVASIDLTKFDGETEKGFPEGQYFTSAAIWAKRAGLLPTDGAFTGNETTTRNQMAVMLTKYLTSMGKDTTPPAQSVAFGDASAMTGEGNRAFQVLYQYGIFKGTGGLMMEPAGSTTRAQFAALMHRIYDTANN